MCLKCITEIKKLSFSRAELYEYSLAYDATYYSKITKFEHGYMVNKK